MIDLRAAAALSARERHALGVLVDLSAIVPCDAGADGAVLERSTRLAFDEATAGSASGFERGAGSPFRASDGVVHIPRALVGTVADLLTMRAETAHPARDRHGRPMSAHNALVGMGREREPVVSAFGLALAAAVRAAAGQRPVVSVRRWPGGARFAVALTHDLDAASVWPVFTALRAAELARKLELTRLARTMGAAVGALLGDPIRRGVDEALSAEAAAGARSTWFVITGTPTFASFRAGDVTYSPESARVRAIVAAIRAAGHEVGLHGSMVTAHDGAAFAAQRARLRMIAGSDVDGVRQHFLRRTPGTTERAMHAAGFRYDSTCGFPDRNGFRAGVADVFPVWDDGAGGELALEEAPFCWMDRAQSKYQGIEDPERWVADAIELAHRCRDVEGLWCGIWHPNLTDALGFPGAAGAYARLVRELASERPWAATLDEIVRWRTGRRALRVTGWSATGVPHVAGPQGTPGAGHSYEVFGASDAPLRVGPS